MNTLAQEILKNFDTLPIDVSGDELQIYRPDGEPFASFTELAQQRDRERQRAETERQRAETERQRAETERQRADSERQRADSAQSELQEEQQRRLAMEAKLREMGIDPQQL